MAIEVDATETRILGSLVEKQRTTPDAYPLTLNALRLACNQATNRDPVVDYDEETVEGGLRRLRERRLVRVASMPGRRTVKYRHLLDQALGLEGDTLSVLAVLMLRGPQTPGELKQRTERLHRFVDLEGLEAALDRLAERGLARRLDRRAGEKQIRYAHLLGAEAAHPAAAPPALADGEGELVTRVEALERAVEALRDELEGLRAERRSVA